MQDALRAVVRAVLQPDLRHLDVPVADAVPRELVERLRREVEVVRVEVLADRRYRLGESREDVAVLEFAHGVGQLWPLVAELHQDEPGHVPQLVEEVARVLELRRRRPHRAPLGRRVGHREAERVGAVLVHQLERVDGVPLRLAHLPPLRIDDQRGDIDGFERDLVAEVKRRHDHPRHPEEDDVERRHEELRRVVGRQLRRLLRPAHDRERPQPRREPRVEHVLVLTEIDVAAVVVPCLLGRVGLGVGGERSIVRSVPDRNPVPPPQLARDAPVADVLHPVDVQLRPAIGDEPDAAVLHDLDRPLRQGLHPHEPLRRDQRLDRRVTPFAVADRVPVRLDLLEVPVGLQPIDDRLPCRLAVHPGERSAVLVDRPVGVQDVDRIEAVRLTDLEVDRVVRRGDLERPGPELGIDQLSPYDRKRPTEDRKARRLADQMSVPLVVGMNGDRRVPEHRLRARRGDRHRAAALERILDVVEGAVDLLVLHLEVGDRRLTSRAPVDEVGAAVDQLLVVEADEHLADRVGQPLVEGEPEPRPVARAAERLQLIDDLGAVLRLPRPHPLDERLAPQVVPGGPLVGELLLDHVLGRNSGVIGPRKPARLVAVHPVIPDDDVLERVVQRVAHVEAAGDVRRRDDDGEAIPVDDADGGPEEAPLFPEAVVLRFDLRRLVALRQLHDRPPFDRFRGGFAPGAAPRFLLYIHSRIVGS